MPELEYVRGMEESLDIGDHPFPLAKYSILTRLLQEELKASEEHFHDPTEVSAEDIARIHTPRYLSDLEQARKTWATTSSELPVTREVISAFRRLLGASAQTVRLALDRGMGFCIGGGFHHAFPDHAEGFCYFHDMAIAVEKARAETDLERVLFLDVDVHQGNGTALIYKLDEDTFTYSIHQEHNYPLKQRSDLDTGLPDGVSDEEYLERLGEDLDTVDERFADPQLVCYVAGVDPFLRDQLGGLALTEEGLRRRDELVFSRYRRARVPVAIFLAGGYAGSAEETARLHFGTAQAAQDVLDQCR
ncbi:MAG TPA: histone deacetylase [Candidatus Krumholzibacteria bacterium]|nr:histone deacetylase [Candidatus Krumholzibacteria bacterium]